MVGLRPTSPHTRETAATALMNAGADRNRQTKTSVQTSVHCSDVSLETNVSTHKVKHSSTQCY